MTAFSINAGGTVYFDQQTGGSTNATLDTYTISNNTTFVIRTDSYACSNHSTAFGSLDNVSYSGLGGKLKFDPTYTRQISYTGGSGTVPAYGTTISQGGVSGVFLGVWADWQSQVTVPGSAMPASGYMKLGGITGGSFAAGALTGITATCSGADSQSWIEVLAPDTAVINLSQVLEIRTDATTWFDLGTTNGSAGQIIPCPTTGSNAGTFPAVWIETSAGSGVYDRYASVGSKAASAVNRTTSDLKWFWSTTSGIRLGHDGTNAAGYTPPTGCNVRIPAVILNCCTRTAGGSGNRVVPSATLTTRQELSTIAGGVINLRGVCVSWYCNFDTCAEVNLTDVAAADKIIIRNTVAPYAVSNLVIASTQAQVQNPALLVNYNLNGGTMTDSAIWRYNNNGSGGDSAVNCNGNKNITFTNCEAGFFTERALSTIHGFSFTSSGLDNKLINCTVIGGMANFQNQTRPECDNLTFYNGAITTTTTSANSISAVQFIDCESPIMDGITIPNGNYGPWNNLLLFARCLNGKFRNFGTYASPIALTITRHIFGSSNGSSGCKFQRMYATGTVTKTYEIFNTDTDLTIEHVHGDDADATTTSAQTVKTKSCRFAGSTSGQSVANGSHWLTRFESDTVGKLEIQGNKPTAATASEHYTTAGAPIYDGNGRVYLTALNDAVVWELPYFALGYTAFTNSTPSVVGANVASSGNGVWGNHLLEFQIDTGSGWNGSWLTLTGANLSGQTISPSSGFKIKVRATCTTGSTSNQITNIRIAMDTTSSAQSTNLYPLDIHTLSINGLVSGTDIIIYEAGTFNILKQVDNNSGTTYDYEYYAADTVDISFYKAGYKVKSVKSYSLGTEDSELLISQTADASYA